MSSSNDPMTTAIDGLARLNLLAEATVGYRKKLIDGGVGREIADAMAKDYHDALLSLMREQIRKKTDGS